jgi:DNA-directed RNA polymerase specialized sigma24 family protein
MDAFLVGTALNVVRREIRRRVRDRRFAGDTALDEVPAPVVPPERRAEAQRLLRRLPRRDRRLVLMWAAGVSLRELADDEGVTPAVVKRRLATARHRAGLDRR